MPVVHSLSKVQKTIKKSKGAMHPKGRKFKQLNRASLREVKINEKKAKYIERKEHEFQRVLFFQEAIRNRPDQVRFSIDEVKVFIEAFLSREDEEIAELQTERRKGRPASNRQTLLENKRKHEDGEYDSGFLIPDINDLKTSKFLREWNGTTGGITQLKFVRVAKNDAELPHVDAPGDRMEI